MVGPDYRRPAVPVADNWIEANQGPVRTDSTQPSQWWEVFHDATLARLVQIAYAQNLGLRAAGLRVVEAQARRGITIGGLFPQTQALSGSYNRTVLSKNSFGAPSGSSSGITGATAALGGGRSFDTWQAGFDVTWELDFWGKFRRAIESSDAQLLAAVASYDDVLVSLVAEVAATYVEIRVLDERLAVARDNVGVQQDSLRIADVRYQAGGTSERDVAQAKTLLYDTEATIPQLETQQRQSLDSLSILLGVPPSDLTDVLGSPGRVPEVPTSVAVGIPADLLRRRPDVRSAELTAVAQSAQIGVAKSELLPAFQLIGSVGLSAVDAGKFFEGRSFNAQTGPAVNWPILNYGRLINNVRLQDATFQELLANYANAVLVAQRDVEDALVGYLRGRDQVASLDQSVAAANRAVDLSIIQYRQGATDYTAVLNTQQSKLRESDLLASTRGAVALSVVSLFKALGGGWELREGQDFVDDQTRGEMRSRTPSWNGMLSPESRGADVDKASADREERPWWRGRWWWPKW